jgi:hypothetical protein
MNKNRCEYENSSFCRLIGGIKNNRKEFLQIRDTNSDKLIIVGDCKSNNLDLI